MRALTILSVLLSAEFPLAVIQLERRQIFEPYLSGKQVISQPTIADTVAADVVKIVAKNTRTKNVKHGLNLERNHTYAQLKLTRDVLTKLRRGVPVFLRDQAKRNADAANVTAKKPGATDISADGWNAAEEEDAWNYKILEDPDEILTLETKFENTKVHYERYLNGMSNEKLHNFHLRTQKNAFGPSGGWPRDSAYSHEFARRTILGVCAAAYAPDPLPCLQNTFRNIEVYRSINASCDNYSGPEVCAAFTAIHHDGKAIIVAFRGTNTIVQLIIELKTSTFRPMVESPIGGKIGAYFKEVFDVLWFSSSIGEDVKTLAQLYSDYTIYFAGHSLGGALASIGAAHSAADGQIDTSRIRVVTLGQPRTGDEEYGRKHEELMPNATYRVVNRRDIVSHVPPLRFRNYTHHKAEVWYSKNMKIVDKANSAVNFSTVEAQSPQPYKICVDAAESNECSNQYGYYSVFNHIYYFDQRVGNIYATDCLISDDSLA